MTFRTEPAEVVLPEAAISALVTRERDGSWKLTAIISRRPPAGGLIPGSEVEAQITTFDGTPLRLLSRPSGELVEAGGSNRSSANAVFRFMGLPEDPHSLSISWRGHGARFRIVRD